jgi:hypothetical protein
MSDDQPERPLSDLERAYRLVPMNVREDLLRFCGVWSPNLETEPLAMARNEGRRLAGLYLCHMLGEVILPKEAL